MISHKHKFIFIQIPKTACTSVQNALHKYGCGGVDHGKDFWNKTSFKHIKYGELEKKLNMDILNSYFKFTFVRNPFDWLVSNYHYSRGLHIPYLKRNISDKNKNIIYDENLNCINVVKANRKKFNAMKISSMEFKDWIRWYVRNIHGTQFEMFQNKDKKNCMDIVGKVENLQKDFDLICEKIGISDVKLSHENKTNHDHYTTYYDSKTRDFVLKNYYEDLNYFNYKFED